MFGIRPLKTLFMLGVLFILFLATRVDPSQNSTQAASESNKTKPLSLLKKSLSPQKAATPNDAVKVLHHLFHNKIQDKAMQCRYKKAKKRYFIACKDGDIIKDNYWEFALKKRQLQLLARSKSAIYIIKRYKFKELRQDTQKAYPKVEKALIAFFNKH